MEDTWLAKKTCAPWNYVDISRFIFCCFSCNATGPVGMAAAAAINSSKKRKRPHSFETNPSIRRRQQTRLLRKLRQTIDEYATRVGQQAVVLIATPGKPQNNFRVFGAKPLEDVIKNIKCTILQVRLVLRSTAKLSTIPSTFSTKTLSKLGYSIFFIGLTMGKKTRNWFKSFLSQIVFSH